MTLPPLPVSAANFYPGVSSNEWVPGYTPAQMRDYARAAIAAHAGIAAVPAQPVSDELIESLWFDAQRAWGEQTSVHPGEHVLFARLLERRIAAAPQAVPAPAGWVLVPVEPTIAMLCDAVKAWEGPAVYKVMSAAGLSTLEEQAADAYRAMLAAAPKEQP